MEHKNITKRLLVGLLAMDFIMGPGGSLLFVAGVDVLDVKATVLLCLMAMGVQVATWVIPTLRAAASLRAWELEGTACTDEELLAADRTIESLPVRVALLKGLAWPAFCISLLLGTAYVFPDIWAYGAPELAEMGFVVAAMALGPPVVTYPIANFLLKDQQLAIGAEVGRRGLEQSRLPAPMERRMIVAALSLVCGFVCWLSGVGWIENGETARQVAAVELREKVRYTAKDLAAGVPVPPEIGESLDRDELPAMLVDQVSDDTVEPVSIVDKRHDVVIAAAPVGDGRWVVAETRVVYDTDNLWVRFALVVANTIFGVGVMMLAMAQMITAPLHRLRESLRRVTEAGVLSEIGRIPVVRRDEIGELTNEFNHMLDVFEELAGAAQAVAAGDLKIEIDGVGDLQDSFRAMVARLSELVLQIREASLEVAGATSEIHAATREQERAASQQSDEIREVSIAISRLADSAGDISTAASEVLSNAEETRKRADKVVEEIAELGRHITRVSELLELIREVADRSDLLALNGSLEATRAGEAGRGFALVANEMRRLAERVTGTVADVRSTVASIESSNRATVEATQHSRGLAGSTTAAARRIVDIIHTQGTETELVSTAARTIADAVASSAAAVTQTRASADGLRERAERLERLIEQFEVIDRNAEHHSPEQPRPQRFGRKTHRNLAEHPPPSTRR